MLLILLTFYLGLMLLLISFMRVFYGVDLYLRGVTYFIEWEIFSFNRSRLIITLLFDWISLSFIGLVLFISSIVIFYRTFYINGDKFFIRFILLVYLFVVSIVFLILSPNIISILLGWDGLGLVSYCLVIYYQNVKSSNAGIITILSNRVGDVAILIRIAWILNFGGWNFFYLQFMFKNFDSKVVLWLVILAAITKRAQIPFSAWLPAAIAAPTPVSALVHSSTLVTAGVYLLIRFNYLLGENIFLFYIGVLTIFISGAGANLEIDLKKIIALSTLSQLGLIITTLRLGFWEFSFFHLMTHAIFKSLLFLCAGVFIHSMGDTQDIRSIGGLLISCPVVSFYFIIASFALCGFPFLSGFYSKDSILELFFMTNMNYFMFFIIFFSTIFTLSYSVRLIYYIFISNVGPRTILNLDETKGYLFSITSLTIIRVILGAWIRIIMFPVGLIYLPGFIKTLVLIFLFSLFIGLFYFLGLNNLVTKNLNLYFIYIFGSIWFLPILSRVILMPFFKIGNYLIKLSDQGWFEFSGGQGLILRLNKIGSKIDSIFLINLKVFLFLIFSINLFILFMAL